MAVKIGKSSTAALGFQLRVQKLDIRQSGGHSRARVSLSAIPTPPFFDPHAAFLGSIKSHKITLKQNSPLKLLLKKIDWDSSKLHPLKDFLRNTLIEGRKHPDQLVSILEATVSTGCIPDFEIQFSPENSSVTPTAVTVTSLPQEVQSLNFQILPTKIRVQNHSKKIQLEAILSQPGFSTDARFIGTIHHHKRKFSFNHDLEKVLADIGWQKSDFKPLEDFLRPILRKSDRDPDLVIGMLATFLKGEVAPNFVLNKSI